jgi:hypothetical protein
MELRDVGRELGETIALMTQTSLVQIQLGV